MRKVAIGCLAALVAGSLLAPAQAGKRRVETAEYEFSPLAGAGISAWFGGTLGVFFGGYAEFPTKKKEHRAKVTITDDSGNAVAASAWQETGSTSDLNVQFCGESPTMHIEGGVPLQVQVFLEVTPGLSPVCDLPEVPTTGTIEARF